MKSFWREDPTPHFPALAKNLKVDVVVVGAGITGLTAGYLLKKHGKTVAVIDRDKIGAGESGNTTAHLTISTDELLKDLVKTFGKDHAYASWDAGRAAIEFIHEVSHKEQIDCDFSWVPHYFHKGQGPISEADLQEELRHIHSAGFDAQLIESTPLFSDLGIVLPHQAKFTPFPYLSALATAINNEGSYVFEQSEAGDFDEKTQTLKSNGHTLSFDWLVIATHNPVQALSSLPAAALFQTKLYGYTSYVVRAAIAKDSANEALYEDSADPYNYLRIDRGDKTDFAILGGLDEKTGQEQLVTDPYQKLARDLRKILPVEEITHTWSGQVIETHDGLPYIGEIKERQFLATGFSGNGYTFGTMAGIMAFHRIVGARNPWFDLFDPLRKNVLGGTWDYLKENIDFPYYLIKDRLRKDIQLAPEDLKTGEGAILKIDGKRVAAYKAKDGTVSLLSPTCTHLGCVVHWNGHSSCWDCPCHGSRFKPTGEVLAGPAEKPLAAASS